MSNLSVSGEACRLSSGCGDACRPCFGRVWLMLLFSCLFRVCYRLKDVKTRSPKFSANRHEKHFFCANRRLKDMYTFFSFKRRSPNFCLKDVNAFKNFPFKILCFGFGDKKGALFLSLQNDTKSDKKTSTFLPTAPGVHQTDPG